MQDKALLVVSFGTSYKQTCERTIEALESDLRAHFPDRRFYRAWTSRIIRRKLAVKGEVIDSVDEALERMQRDGIRDLLIQTTHVLPGEEYALILEAAERYRSSFASLHIGSPLLDDHADLTELAAILERYFPQADQDSLLVFMGHGSSCLNSPVYQDLEEVFRKDGYTNYCVGTVEFDPGFTPILRRIRGERPRKVFLTPLMVVAGDHAINDMAGNDPDSWQSQIRAEGVDTECLLKGLGEYPEIRAMYVRHAESPRPL